MASLGVLAGGSFEGEGRRFDVKPGFLASFTGGYRLFGGADGQLYGVTTLSMGFSRARIEDEATGKSTALSASDLRVGAEVGVTLFERLRPFAVGRAFGGPVQARIAGEDRVGSDRRHYAVGVGVGTDAGRGLDLRFESTLLGERAFVWSGAFSF
ncbi:MAG: hypothetical protein IT377_33175 [Polyangiaceae bacterium]|nr:hypothetical protein [Polyangiaceae bacterium]